MLKDFLQKAYENHFALGAFNLDSFEALITVAKAALNLKSPVLVEVSPGEIDFLGFRNLAAIVDNTKRELGVPLFLNLDHASDLSNIEKALDFGFDLVHFDGGKLPLEENITKAKQVVSWAHAKNVLVEGEIDHFVGSSEYHQVSGESPHLTDIAAAKRFVDETGIDLFAVSIGNKHGFYADGSKHLEMDHFKKVKEVLPDTLFSLHGGSGIPEEEIKAAISMGVVKININSEIRIAWRTNLKESLETNANEYTWSKLVEKPLEEVQKVIEEKISIFKNNATADN